MPPAATEPAATDRGWTRTLTAPPDGKLAQADLSRVASHIADHEQHLEARHRFVVRTTNPAGFAVDTLTLLTEVVSNQPPQRLHVTLPADPPAAPDAASPAPCGHLTVDHHTYDLWAIPYGPHIPLMEYLNGPLPLLAALNETDAALLHEATEHPQLQDAVYELRSGTDLTVLEAFTRLVLDPLPADPALRTALTHTLAAATTRIGTGELAALAAALTD